MLEMSYYAEIDITIPDYVHTKLTETTRYF